MIAAPIPIDDERRLQALRELLILDTPPEEHFDRVVQFAAGTLDEVRLAIFGSLRDLVVGELVSQELTR